MVNVNFLPLKLIFTNCHWSGVSNLAYMIQKQCSCDMIIRIFTLYLGKSLHLPSEWCERVRNKRFYHRMIQTFNTRSW